jgi:hypothetical protein
MALVALQSQPEPKATPRSNEWCEIGQQGFWRTVFPLHEQWHVTLYYSVKSHFGTEFLPLDIRKSRGQSNVSVTGKSAGPPCPGKFIHAETSPPGDRKARLQESTPDSTFPDSALKIRFHSLSPPSSAISDRDWDPTT